MRELSKSLEDYLETILILENNNEELLSIKIAKHLGVSRPAVSRALKVLARKGLISKMKYDRLYFTKEGRALARKIYHRHNTIKKFLLSLGLEEKTAETDCCKIEHVISNDTLRALVKFNDSKK